MKKTRWARGSVVALCGALIFALMAGCATTGKPEQAPAKPGAAAVKEADAKAVEETVEMPTSEIMKNEPAPDAAAASPAAEDTSDTFAEYTIGAGDQLSFRFFDDDTLSAEVVVRYDGYVSLPLIPDVKLGSLTRDEAVDVLKKAYGKFYQDPQLTLSILSASSKTFAVIGDVSQPGEYPYVRPINLIDGINAAGGIRLYQRAGDSFVGAQGQLVKAVIIRNKGDKREVISRDLRNFQQSGPHPSETRVLPGDIVYVPESINLVYVLGEVKGSGVFSVTEGMTMLELLARAGGFIEQSGRLRHVVLLREEQAGRTKVMLVNVRRMLKQGGDIKILPGDVVYVPRKPLINVQAFVQRFTGTVSPVLSLYRQAYDAYYADQYFRQLVGNTNSNTALAVQQGVTNANAFQGITNTGAK